MSYAGSAADRLAQVRLAISNCLQSQQISSKSGTQVMAQLRDLRAMEKELQLEVGFEENGGSMVSLGFQDRLK